jgi:hypothetical protein
MNLSQGKKYRTSNKPQKINDHEEEQPKFRVDKKSNHEMQEI